MLIVISGVSGGGKTTLANRLLAESEIPLRKVITYTTRPIREGEKDGVDYHFCSVEEFQKFKDNHLFVEDSVVYGHHYGTPFNKLFHEGEAVLLVTDIQGFRKVQRALDVTLSFFVTSSNYKERLISRKTESKEALEKRLKTAEEEMEAAGEYDLVINTDNIDEAVANACSVIKSGYAGKVVYLSGGIRNCTEREKHEWREKAKKLLRTVTIDPTRMNPNKMQTEEMVELDKADIARSTHLLVYYIRPSVGTSMEMLHAWERGKAIYVVNEKGLDLSPWMIYHSHKVFDTLEQAVERINKD